MSLSTRNALNAYSQAGLDAKVAAASPQGLITMLFDGAIAAVSRARYFMERVGDPAQSTPEDISEKGMALSKAIAIIDDGLKASLNLDAGGELAENLYSLYEYLSYRLVNANLKNDTAALEEVVARLSEIRDAWVNMDTRPANSTIAAERTVSPAGVVTYGRV